MKQIIARSIPLLAGAIVSLSVLAQTGPGSANTAAGKIQETGRWITESGNLEVEIAPCGQALCGTVVKVIANNSMSAPGTAMTPADTRSPLGMKILKDFTPSGDGEWKGRIYNRESGETYDCVMALLAPDQLKVRGYKGLPLFGKTQVWSRVPGQAAQ